MSYPNISQYFALYAVAKVIRAQKQATKKNGAHDGGV
jgi:hypothetical protein